MTEPALHCPCPDHLQARLTKGCPCGVADHVHELPAPDAPSDAGALPPGPYRVEPASEQGGLWKLWGRQGALPDLPESSIKAIGRILNAPPPSPSTARLREAIDKVAAMRHSRHVLGYREETAWVRQRDVLVILRAALADTEAAP